MLVIEAEQISRQLNPDWFLDNLALSKFTAAAHLGATSRLYSIWKSDFLGTPWEGIPKS